MTKLDGTKAYNSKEKAEALNEYFGSVYQDESDNIPPATKTFSGIPLVSSEITHELVMDNLNALNPGKSTGLDRLHPYFLCSLADILCTPLKILFNKSLRERVVPSQWLEACITAIHKKGLKSAVGNYRLVSITSVVCKMMESIIRDHIVAYMSSNNLFANEQHGFLPNRDCMTNLLSALEVWTEAIESGCNIDVIYTDFAKAFDTVPQRLLIKLESIGIVGEILRWIMSFLTGRKHKVCVDGECSSWACAKSGILGSVLGTALFAIFINDMPNAIKNSCMLFADHAKLYRTIQTKEDASSLQEDIDSLVRWSLNWQLSFSVEKCKIMRIGNDKNPQTYYMNGQPLDYVKEEKDLGVVADNRLKFRKHAASAVKQANKVLGLIKHSFTALDDTTLPLLYTSMVRPHLEYGNIIWGPHFKEDMKAVERVKKRATRVILRIKDLPYTQRLKALNLPSLSYRRKRGDMIMCYKVMTNKVKVKVKVKKENFFSLNNNTPRGHMYKLHKNQRAIKQPRSESFAIRSINDWNSLPSKVVQAESTNHFKNQLDKYWESKRFESSYM